VTLSQEHEGFVTLFFSSPSFSTSVGLVGSVGQLVPCPLSEKWESGEGPRSFPERDCRVTSPLEKLLSDPEAQGLVLFCRRAIQVGVAHRSPPSFGFPFKLLFLMIPGDKEVNDALRTEGSRLLPSHGGAC